MKPLRLPKLPLTVIAGYLGSGKTTLINRLLAEDHGLRLLVMVNDFGAINIDAELLASAEEDTLTLTNGCVCCTMGADLFMALGDALDRRPRPDHVIIEASGIADPGRIANAAIAEPEMEYGGIVTIVDGQNFPDLIGDAMIGPQIRAQVAQADLVLLGKMTARDTELIARLEIISAAPVLLTEEIGEIAPLLPNVRGKPPRNHNPAKHPAYVSWSYHGPAEMSRERIASSLGRRPAGLYRVKGFVRGHSGESWEVQAVGKQVAIVKAAPHDQTSLVGIGLSRATTRADIDRWWQEAMHPGA